MPKKKPDQLTTREALKHLFPKPLRDALEQAVTDVDDPTPEKRKPASRSKKAINEG